jgi:hypothetical protein
VDELFVETLVGIIEANENFLRFIAEETARFNLNVADLLWWNMGDGIVKPRL